MYIDAVVVKGEGKSFSVQINTVKDGATTNLTANDFVPFPLSGYDDNGDAFAYSVIFRVLGAPTADAEVLVEHLITENSDMEVDGQIDNPTNGQFTFTINKDDTERVMTQWQDTYERDSKEKVKDLDNQDKLNSIAKSQVRNLMKSLGVTGKINIIIK